MHGIEPLRMKSLARGTCECVVRGGPVQILSQGGRSQMKQPLARTPKLTALTCGKHIAPAPCTGATAMMQVRCEGGFQGAGYLPFLPKEKTQKSW